MLRDDIRRFIIPRKYFSNIWLFGGHFLVTVFFQEGLRAILFHRAAHFLHSRKGCGIAFIIAKMGLLINGIYISPETPIGSGCKLNHSGTTIHANCIGKNAEITHNVTIGQAHPFADEYPKIGDNVYIGAGARVFADIGNNAVVGANSVVTKKVNDNSLVVGVPGKIILKDMDTDDQ